MPPSEPGYLAYLLRLWQSPEASSVVWRASLQCVETGSQHAFACLDDLLAYLRQVTASPHPTLPGHPLDQPPG